MRISHTYKFVYISIEKTGSTSVRVALDNLCIDPKLAATINYEAEYTHDYIVSNDNYEHLLFHHTSLKNVHRWFDEQSWNWDKYSKFTFIRYPVDRVLSHYFFHKQDRGFPHIRNRKSLPAGYRLLVDTSKKYDFNKWVEWFYNYTEENHPRCGDFLTSPGNVPNQSSYLYDINNKPMDYIGKSEQSQRDFDYICDNINIPKTTLPRVNISSHKSYDNYCNNDTLKLLSKIYTQDFELYYKQ